MIIFYNIEAINYSRNQTPENTVGGHTLKPLIFVCRKLAHDREELARAFKDADGNRAKAEAR